MTRPQDTAAGADLHDLAQSLAAATLSVDAAIGFLGRQDRLRVRESLDVAAQALEQAGRWIEAQRPKGVTDPGVGDAPTRRDEI